MDVLVILVWMVNQVCLGIPEILAPRDPLDLLASLEDRVLLQLRERLD
jgi:hypothetical protein